MSVPSHVNHSPARCWESRRVLLQAFIFVVAQCSPNQSDVHSNKEALYPFMLSLRHDAAASISAVLPGSLHLSSLTPLALNADVKQMGNRQKMSVPHGCESETETSALCPRKACSQVWVVAYRPISVSSCIFIVIVHFTVDPCACVTHCSVQLLGARLRVRQLVPEFLSVTRIVLKTFMRHWGQTQTPKVSNASKYKLQIIHDISAAWFVPFWTLRAWDCL